MKANNSRQIRIAREMHANCVVCGARNPLGLDLEFQEETDGSMSLTFRDGSKYEGYSNFLHGGIISMLFDAAMVHCLFAHSLAGVTGSLNIRFLLPVKANRPVTIHARLERRKSQLCLLKGILHQDGELKSTAEARFWIVS